MSIGITPGVGRAGPQPSMGFGLDGFIQPSGSSHHLGGKFAGRGFTQATPVRYTAKGQRDPISPPSPLSLSVESTGTLPKLAPARTQKSSPLPRKSRIQGEAMYERNDFIQKSGFGIY